MSVCLTEDRPLAGRASLDVDLVELVRIARADGWGPDPAARQPRECVDDVAFVRTLHARMAEAMLECSAQVRQEWAR